MSIKNQVFHGVKWAALLNVLQQVLSLISIVIYTKLLTPDDFGLFSILMVFMGFLEIFSDLGTSAALIHVEKPTNKLLSSIFYFNLFVGFLLTFALLLISSPIAKFFDKPQLEVLVQAISINFIVISFGVVQRALLQKQIEFKELTLVSSVALVVGLFVGLISAYSGLGVYSLVIQLLVASVLSTGLVWYVSSWRPQWYFSLKEIKSIWKYTSNLSAFTVINYFSKNADNLLIGKYLSVSALGVYSIAYRFMLYPLQNISSVLMKVLFPALSKMQNDDQRFVDTYLKVIFYISLVTFPIMTGLMAVSYVMVDVLFSDEWEGLAALLIILAPSGLLRSIYTTVGPIFMAKGSTDVQLKLGAVNAILTVLGFSIGLNWGVSGVAIAYLVVNLIMLYPTFKISWGQIGLSVSTGLTKLMSVFIIAASMGIIVYLLDIFIYSGIDNELARLIVNIFSGVILYLSSLHIHYGGLKKILIDFKR